MTTMAKVVLSTALALGIGSAVPTTGRSQEAPYSQAPRVYMPYYETNGYMNPYDYGYYTEPAPPAQAAPPRSRANVPPARARAETPALDARAQMMGPSFGGPPQRNVMPFSPEEERLFKRMNP